MEHRTDRSALKIRYPVAREGYHPEIRECELIDIRGKRSWWIFRQGTVIFIDHPFHAGECVTPAENIHSFCKGVFPLAADKKVNCIRETQ